MLVTTQSNENYVSSLEKSINELQGRLNIVFQTTQNLENFLAPLAQTETEVVEETREVVQTKKEKPFGSSKIHRQLLSLSDNLDNLNDKLNNIINFTEF